MNTVRDPVCGTMVNEETTQYKRIHENNVYYFCSTSCLNKFSENPGKYLRKSVDLSHHASHYGGYCPTTGCGQPAKGVAWYFYVGLLILLLLAVFLFSFARFLI